jgi:hypothetical protein
MLCEGGAGSCSGGTPQPGMGWAPQPHLGKIAGRIYWLGLFLILCSAVLFLFLELYIFFKSKNYILLQAFMIFYKNVIY